MTSQVAEPPRESYTIRLDTKAGRGGKRTAYIFMEREFADYMERKGASVIWPKTNALRPYFTIVLESEHMTEFMRTYERVRSNQLRPTEWLAMQFERIENAQKSV